MFTSTIRMDKKFDLKDFDHGMIVGARKGGLSILETANLLGFSCTTVSRVCREWCEKLNISSEQQFCGQKCLVNKRGQRRRARLVEADRKVTQITTHYNSGMQKSMSGHPMRQISKWIAAEDVSRKNKCNKYLIKCLLNAFLDIYF